MILRCVPKRMVINQYGFFSSLKDRYIREKYFHLLDKVGSVIEDDAKQLELRKYLVIMRSEIDGKDKVGIQTIKSYLDYLSFQDIYLHKYKKIEKVDEIFYQSIEEKCQDVDLIKQATLSSKIFYYLNGGDYKLLCLELKCQILVRKLNSNDAQNKIEEVTYIGLLKDAVEEYVDYTQKHYSCSELILMKAILVKEEFHLRQAQLSYNQGHYQAAIDEIVKAQTQMNEFWSNCSQKEEIRILHQAKLINKLITLGRIKCQINQPEGFQIIVDALKMYEDNIGIDDTYQEHFMEIVQFLRCLDENKCLLLLEGIYNHPLNQQRLESQKLRVSLLFNKGQLKECELDQMIETYRGFQAEDNNNTCYDILLFFALLKNFFNNKEAAFKLLEEAIRKFQFLSLIEQSTGIIKIVSQIIQNSLQQDSNSLQIIELSIQILDKSCFRLKDNFSKLEYNEQVNTINTERCILFLQYYLDCHQISENCEGSQYQETFNRLCYLESLFQANERLKLPILEILNNIQVEDKEVVEKIKDVRQKILDTEVVI